jgi:putative spermidine/putrescine transport system ATP-binding protein
MTIDGQPLNPLPPYKRNIGVVFQNYTLFPHMTVAKNVAFPLEMRGEHIADIARKVARVLNLVGLPGYERRYPAQLSGGQQQRIALARAIVFEPRLLLMDEPLGALDKKLREQMQLEIMRLHREIGMSVIYVTHDQDEALVMSNRIAVFNGGRIEQIAPPQELYERPRSRFVADFLGESNFFPAVITELGDGYCRLSGANAAFRVRTSGPLTAGQEVVLAVRPERIRLQKQGSSTASVDNCVAGRVRDLVYLGRARKYIVSLSDNLEVVVLEQATDGAGPSFALEEPVLLTWRAEDASALPA